jgi:DNA primase catalytic core
VPRIPEADLQRLKEEISVERLVEGAGIELKRSGKDLLGRCPFHADGEPSLVVTPSKNLWHCFGCQVGGGPLDWVMKARGVSFRHAVELLKADPSLAAGGGIVKHGTRRVLAAPVSLDADDQQLLDDVVDYYHQTLKSSPEALAYLDKRGLANEEAIATFKLGYANRTLGLRLPEKNRAAGEALRGRLQKLGILRDSGHEHFNGSLVVPVFNEQGHVTEIYGRKIRGDLRPGTAKHLYLPERGRGGRGRGVWNLAAFSAPSFTSETGVLILCEALLDALTFWCAGFTNVTATYGAECFTEDHAQALHAFGVRRVLLAFDRDKGGDQGAAALAPRLHAQGIEPYRVLFPHGMDANDYALKVKPAAPALAALLRGAQWMGPAGSAASVVEQAAAPPPIAASEPAPPSLAAEEERPAGTMPPAPPSGAIAAPPAVDVPCEISDAEVLMTLGTHRWRVRGLAPAPTPGQLKVNLLVAQAEAFHVDTLDLYSARARAAYLKQAAAELVIDEAVLKRDLGAVLLKLEQLQAERALAKAEAAAKGPALTLTDAEKDAALQLLRAPDLLERIVADFDACGLVGERTNKLVGYLAAVSRKLDAPLAVVVQSSSAAGKSSLMDAVLAFVPEEEREKYSALTGQSLFYMGESNLAHKCLAICEEEGASRAAYALKLLQSDGELTIASTGKDETTGKLVTQHYRVQGPVMLFLTSTAIDIDEELLNRCLVLSVDEGREQTEAIHRLQRQKRTLAGLLAKRAKEALLKTHRNAQRLLRPLAVMNPYADRLTFLADKTRMRRDHEKYLTLIDTIALLHQHQRPVAVMADENGDPIEYVEVTLADIAAANAIAHEVLGRSLDELPPQTRKLLAQIVELVATRCRQEVKARPEVRFTRAQVRAHAGLSDTQCRLHLERLVSLEYVLVHRGSRGHSFEYELLYDGDAGVSAPHLPGLIDVEALQIATTTAGSRGQNGGFAGVGERNAGSTRAQRAPIAGGSRTAQSLGNPRQQPLSKESARNGEKLHLLEGEAKQRSYPQADDRNGIETALPLAAAARA